MFRGIGRTAVRVFAGSAFALLLVAPIASAGLTGPDSNSAAIAAPAAKPKPYSPVTTTAQGSCTVSNSACADTPCTGGHTCACVAFSGFATKFPGAGAVTMNAEINVDINVVTPAGVSSCLLAYGQGTGTVKGGASISLFFNGQTCGTGTAIDSTGGTWLVPEGSGATNHANGVGRFSISHNDALGTGPCVITMDGAFRKTP